MKSMPLLVLPVLMLLLVGCSGGTSESEIEATVDPRLEQAKASLVPPTPALLPTYTPYPTWTPVPIPTPALLPTYTPYPTWTPALLPTYTPYPTWTPVPPVTMDPENPLDKEAAIEFMENGEVELAIEHINRHIKLYPRDTSSYVIRGFAYAALNRFQDALDDFNVVLTLPSVSTDPDEVRNQKRGTFQIIAYLYWELGLLQDSYNNLDNLFHVDEDLKTITISEFATNSETQKTIKWLIDGINYLNDGLYGKAIESFTEFIDCTWAGKPPVWGSMPEGCTEHNYNVFITWQGGNEHPIGYFHRGVAYKELGDLQKATSDFTKVIELDPDNSRGFSRKAADAMPK